MLGAVEGNGLIHHLKVVEAKGVALEVARNDKSRIDKSDELNAQSSFDAVLLTADKLADPVGDLIVGINTRNVDHLALEAQMTEGNVLSVHRKLALVIINVNKLNSAYEGIVKSGALKGAGLAVHRAAALYELGALMLGAEGVVIRAEMVHISHGHGASGGINGAVKVCVTANDVDP